MKRAIIDRFEGEWAVCELEDESFTHIKIDRLPEDAREGDTIVISEGSIELDREATHERRVYMDKLMEDMWE